MEPTGLTTVGKTLNDVKTLLEKALELSPRVEDHEHPIRELERVTR